MDGNCISRTWSRIGGIHDPFDDEGFFGSWSFGRDHGDDGGVSVNFWVTADSANSDPDRGGLIIHRREPPPDWQISDYTSDVAAIRTYLGDDETERIVIPYGENRAVLFNSRLFHESDDVDFQPGYENQRINITMLFGEKGRETL